MRVGGFEVVDVDSCGLTCWRLAITASRNLLAVMAAWLTGYLERFRLPIVILSRTAREKECSLVLVILLERTPFFVDVGTLLGQ